jgi:hypothetical protein
VKAVRPNKQTENIGYDSIYKCIGNTNTFVVTKSRKVVPVDVGEERESKSIKT